jgi:hypothetical protein
MTRQTNLIDPVITEKSKSKSKQKIKLNNRKSKLYTGNTDSVRNQPSST